MLLLLLLRLTAIMIDVMRCDIKRYFWWWQSTPLSGVV